MNRPDLDPGLPLLQEADLKDKVVLVRVDHNVVKKGAIKDPYRIDATLGTLYNIVERGGRPILMTHVGRPKDKKSGHITVSDQTSVAPIVQYLERKLHTTFGVPEFPADPEKGLRGIDTSINWLLRDLKERRLGGLYLPNTRWFEGEETSGPARESLARQLGGLADIYVNDAFGSWQPHASTFHITRYLPSYAGFLMQKELINLKQVLQPRRPFVAAVAGAKYDTKIGPLKEIYKKVDHLILGGVIYNAFLAAKYGIKVAGVSDSDVALAGELVEQDRNQGKIAEPAVLIESDVLESREEGRYRRRQVKDFRSGDEYGYLLDVAPESFDQPELANIFGQARTIFINAVMGFTPNFFEGTQKMDETINGNPEAYKLFGGGDTLQDFKNFCPGVYMSALNDPRYYFFTGGGTVLKAIQQGSPYGLEPVQALIANGGNSFSPLKAAD